jgi:hypothetical protein
VIVSCLSYSDAATGAAAERLYSAAGRWVNHSPADVESFFVAAGLQIAHGRPMDVRCWPTCPVEAKEPAGALVLGGIGLKS